MTTTTATREGLETVYPESHALAARIYWDPREGAYYDSGTDLYLHDYDPQTQTTKELT